MMMSRSEQGMQNDVLQRKERKKNRNSKYEHIHIAPPHPLTHTTTKIPTWVILLKTGPKRVPLSQSNKNLIKT